jgi:uncharacterized membrane protein YeaQ/YmgE (transglycosylase-associated protein family)
VGIGGFFSALIVGAIIGGLGRLVVPGKQNMAIWLTIVVGIVAALLGAFVAGLLTDSFLITLILQVALAAGGVVAVGAVQGRNRI